MNFLKLLLITLGFAFGVDNISTPTDYNTVSTGNRANLAANFSEIETKFNSSVDSLEQVRALFLNYTGNLTVVSKKSMIMELDDDQTETALFLVRSGGGDSLFYVSEDSTVKFWGAVTYDNLTASRLTATDANKAVASVSDLTSWIAGTTNQVTVTDDGDGTVTLSTPQDIGTSSAVTFATVNTGQGAYELYAMNQDVETTDAVTFTTVNTGQGAYELYAMDQNVLTTSDPTFDSLQLTDLYVSDRIGIGVSAPDGNLHLFAGSAGSVTGTGNLVLENSVDFKAQIITPNNGKAIIQFGDPNDLDPGEIQYDHGDNFLRIKTNDVERVRIDSSGNVGIGATPSGSYTLEVNGTVSTGGNFYIAPTAATPYVFGGTVGLEFRDNASTKTNLTIKDGGNIGIGTTSPSASLDINTSSGSVLEVNMVDNTINSVVIQQGSNEYLNINTTNATESITYGNNTTNPEHHMLGGNVGIGTTSPSALLHVSSDGGAPSLSANTLAVLDNAGTASNDAELSIISGSSGDVYLNFGDSDDEDRAEIRYDNSTDEFIFKVGGATEKVTINSSGDITHSGNLTTLGYSDTDSLTTNGSDFLTYDEGSFIATYTGFTTTVQDTVSYIRVGKTVTMRIRSTSGTSNTTAMTMTGIPADITPAYTVIIPIPVLDNSSILAGRITFGAGSTTGTFATTIAGGTFTASGSKGPTNTSVTYIAQ